RVYIEDLGARLPKDPGRVKRALEGTKQGADWLIERWEGLGEVLQSNGTWNEAQRRLAFDLRGVPLEFREGSQKVPREDDPVALAALVAEELEQLREHQEATLCAMDEAARSCAVSGMLMEEDAATKRLRQYEARARRVLNVARGELLRVRAGAAPADRPAAGGAAADDPSPRPADTGSCC